MLKPGASVELALAMVVISKNSYFGQAGFGVGSTLPAAFPGTAGVRFQNLVTLNPFAVALRARTSSAVASALIPASSATAR